MKSNHLVAAIFVLLATFSLAQTGIISGKVTDSGTNETIPSVKITIEGLTITVLTDLNGQFTLTNVPIGNQSLAFSFASYNTKILSEVLVQKDEITTLNVTLDRSVKDLGSVVVRVKAGKETDANLVQLQRNSATVIDGISADAIKKTPDRNVGDALKRISGASIQDNKFAVIRGLNDRYNAAYLNGAPLPSSESDRKAFSFDIFPVNMLDNLTIVKTASADLPAEFAGGIIQVKTKDIPEKNFHSLLIGAGYNTITTFNKRVTYKGSSTDWLGIDNGTRALPSEIPSQANFPSNIAEQASLAKTFATDWALSQKTFAPNLNFQYSTGYSKKFNTRELGMIASLSYNKSNNYNQTIRRSYAQDVASGVSQIEYDYLDKVYSSQLLAGAMLNLTLKWNPTTLISFKNLYSINSDDRVIARSGEINPLEKNPTLLRSTARWFTENRIYSGQLTGEHILSKKLRLDWVGSFSRINRSIPNLRRSVYTRLTRFNDPLDPNPLDTTSIASVAQANVGSEYGGGMFFSTNKENIASLKADLTIKLGALNGIESDLKIGGLFQYRNRSFEARQLGYTKYGVAGGNITFNNNLLYLPEESIFRQENMGLLSPGVGGFKLSDGTKPSDSYTATSTTSAGYVLMNNRFNAKWKLNWGGRVEYFTQQLNALRSNKTPLVIDVKKLDILPSFNLIYSPTKKQNLRFSGSQTLNRPEYRELAPFAFYDFNTQFVVAGNDSLQRAKITNLDVRYEWYPGRGQLLSGTVFYKYFKNPIEQIARADVSGEISYQNAPFAVNYGVEIEFRSLIGALVKADSSSFLQHLTLYSNLAIIRSSVDVSANIGTQYASRPLQGQSPYVFNSGIQFDDKKHAMSYSLVLNRVGNRIYILGTIVEPDIWEKSRTFLDFQVSKTFLKGKLDVKLNVQNCLAQEQVFYQNNYAKIETVSGVRGAINSILLGDKDDKNGYTEGKDDLIWSTNFGRTFSFSVTYKF